MKTRHIITTLLLLIIAGESYYLHQKINEPLEREKQIAQQETLVVEKLKMIRQAQKEFYLNKGKYASTWNELISFVDQGTSYRITKISTPVKEGVEYIGFYQEEIITYDTISKMSVKDRIFPSNQYPDFQAQDLPKVPNTDFLFNLKTDKVKMGNAELSTVMVTDPIPEDRRRTIDNIYKNQQNLHFGSLGQVTLEGNWKNTKSGA